MALPESLARVQQAITWFELACRFADLKWARSAGKTRRGIADALATVTPAMVTTRRGMPDSKALRAVLYGWAFHTAHRETVALDLSQARVLAWARDNSVKVVALEEKEQRSETIRRALDLLA